MIHSTLLKSEQVIPYKIVRDKVYRCVICDGVSHVTVNGVRTCGKCIHSGALLNHLIKTGAVRG
ncbi:MAG: hypothetical protein MJY93_08745 [Fibrobacter sp.]|nr:hypothetical protein [Fibrobacter sp.]